MVGEVLRANPAVGLPRQVLAAGLRVGSYEIKAPLGAGSMANEMSPEFSPDGRWLAYVSNRRAHRSAPPEGTAQLVGH